jgi:hypothetical protein
MRTTRKVLSHCLTFAAINNYIEYNNFIKIKNEANEIVWESDKSLEIEFSDYEKGFWDGNYVVLDHYGKGIFLKDEFKINKKFEPSKLTKIISDVCGVTEIIIGFAYDGVRIDAMFENSIQVCIAVNVV